MVTLEVLGDKVADPTMRAAYEEMPWAADASQFTDHDLLANFYRDAEHQILLDAEELAAAGPGVWYVSVHNGVENSEALTFSITSSFVSTLDCPLARDNRMCDGQGTCERNLGRCDCASGRVMDDCSADGVFELTPSQLTASPSRGNAKTISIDGWAFWSIAVGCEDRVLEIAFQTTNDGALPTSSSETRPVTAHGAGHLRLFRLLQPAHAFPGNRDHGLRRRPVRLLRVGVLHEPDLPRLGLLDGRAGAGHLLHWYL